MRLIDSIFGILIFGTSHVADGWHVAPKPIHVAENRPATKFPDGFHSIASDKDGVTKYVLSGTEIDTAPFELRKATNCDPKYQCADLFLKDEWKNENGDTVSVLDRETKSTYTLTLKAVSSTGHTQEEATITITVDDQNDNQPVFVPASLQISCKENLSDGDKCGTVTATDADEDISGKVEYSIPTAEELWYRRDGTPEQRNRGLFNINSESGTITLRNPEQNDWDSEKYERVEIVVQAQDAPGEMARTSPVQQKIIIFIEDENDNRATPSDYPRQSLVVGELTKPNSQLPMPGKKYTFRGSDADVDEDNSRVSFEIASPSNSPFEISPIGNTNDAYLIVNKTLDYETTRKYDLTIRAINRQAKSYVDRMSSQFTVSIQIQDENEPPIWGKNIIEFKENVKSGATPSNGIHPHAEDPDFGGSSSVTYEKLSDPMNYFSIDKKTGRITFMPRNADEVLDRECEYCNWKEGTYNITLQACDDQSSCSEHSQIIKIHDVDDSAPIVNPQDSDSFSVCTKSKGGLVLGKVEISDRDDCNLNHCPRGSVEIADQHRRTFDLVSKSDTEFELRLKDPNTELESRTYEIHIRGKNGGNGSPVNEATSIILLKVCNCNEQDEFLSCPQAVVSVPAGLPWWIWLILALFILLLVLVALALVYKNRRARDSPKGGLLDDIDDETGNIMVYSNEGGGEEDQTNYNTATLIKAKNEVPTSRIPKPIRPHAAFGNGIDPKDIGQYIDDAKNHADADVHAAPYDSLLTFDYEGNNSIIDDLSSTSSELDLGDFDPDNNIASWGPKFRKLADLYAGRENDAFDNS